MKRRVEELEGEFSTTQENSDIFHLNQEKTAELSADTRYLMQEALALGAGNRWCAPIFRFTRLCKAGDLQREITGSPVSERESLLKSVDYRLVGLEADTASIEPGMMVDLGGVGKGFTGDEVVKTMKEDGVTSALFSHGRQYPDDRNETGWREMVCRHQGSGERRLSGRSQGAG
ncbi:MAG: FAD:protein FMN transferase [Clostridium fessum]